MVSKERMLGIIANVLLELEFDRLIDSKENIMLMGTLGRTIRDYPIPLKHMNNKKNGLEVNK